MAKQKKEEEKPKHGMWIAAVVVLFLMIVLIFFLSSRPPDKDDGTSPLAESGPISVDIEVTEQELIPDDETETEETTGLANPAAVYCEEQGGTYVTETETDERSKCEITELKGRVFPWIVESWEAQGLDCEEEEDETGMIPCYETVEYDAWDFWEESRTPETIVE